LRQTGDPKVKRGPSGADDTVMNYAPLLIPANNWMDLLVAADYVGVPYAELVAAATKGELDATVTHPQRPGDWMVRMGTVEEWARRRSLLLTA
jgi:hypothetical protein